MGKSREREIILKTDKRTIFLEMGLGGYWQVATYCCVARKHRQRAAYAPALFLLAAAYR
jgi:hypothetical protein